MWMESSATKRSNEPAQTHPQGGCIRTTHPTIGSSDAVVVTTEPARQICRSVASPQAFGIGHDVRVTGRAIGVAASALLALAGCGSTNMHSESGSAEAPNAAVENLCDAYGAKIHRQAVNVTGTTAGAVAKGLRVAHQPATPWASRPVGQVVALCTYPPPQAPSPSEPTTVCPGGTIVGVEQDVLTFYVGSNAVTAVPSEFVDTPCLGVK
jgi:hypothetical protein